MRLSTAMLSWAAMALSGCTTSHFKSSISRTLSHHFAESASWRIGPGHVGELVPGEQIPDSVYEREGRSFDQLWSKQILHLNHMEMYAKGFRDQSGDRVVNFPNLDVRVSVGSTGVVNGVWVGNTVKTEKGIGVGSSLTSLKNAYGVLNQNPLPEPYNCVMHSEGFPGVMFYFRDDCADVSADSKVVKLQVVRGVSDLVAKQ